MTILRRLLDHFCRRAPALPFLFVAWLEEIDPDLVAVDPGELAAAIGKSGGRQQQEELLQMQSFDRALDGELRTGLGDVFHDAVAPPGAVDAHHVRGYPALEGDAFALAPFGRHCPCSSPLSSRVCCLSMIFSEKPVPTPLSKCGAGFFWIMLSQHRSPETREC